MKSFEILVSVANWVFLNSKINKNLKELKFITYINKVHLFFANSIIEIPKLSGT